MASSSSQTRLIPAERIMKHCTKLLFWTVGWTRYIPIYHSLVIKTSTLFMARYWQLADRKRPRVYRINTARTSDKFPTSIFGFPDDNIDKWSYVCTEIQGVTHRNIDSDRADNPTYDHSNVNSKQIFSRNTFWYIQIFGPHESICTKGSFAGVDVRKPKKNTKDLSQYGLSPGRGLNPVLPKCEAEVAPIWPRISAFSTEMSETFFILRRI
jgi:hypothetical protein